MRYRYERRFHLRAHTRLGVAGHSEMSFFLSKSLGIKVGTDGAGRGGRGAKESSYIASKIGFSAFLIEAFLLEAQPSISFEDLRVSAPAIHDDVCYGLHLFLLLIRLCDLYLLGLLV